MRRISAYIGIIGIVFLVVVFSLRRDVAKPNNNRYISEKATTSTPFPVDPSSSELLTPIIATGEKRLLLRATVDHIATEEKHGVISVLLQGKSNPVITVSAQLGPPDYQQLVRFRTPRVINQKEVSFKTYAVKELLSFLTEGKEIQLELGFAQGTDEYDVFQKNFDTYVETMKVNNSSVQPFVIIYPFIKGIELL